MAVVGDANGYLVVAPIPQHGAVGRHTLGVWTGNLAGIGQVLERLRILAA